MATSYEPRTDLADRLMTRTERGPKVGFGSALFRRLGIADPFAGGDVQDRALTQPRFDFLSSRAYLAELRGLSRRRLMLIDRISGIRSALRSHHAFQQQIATPAVRAASLGLESSTLIDWSSQIDDDVVSEEEPAADTGLASRRRSEEGGLRETSATRALKSEIAQATGVLAQLQRLLDSNRGISDRSLAQRVSALERQAPSERAGSARKLARELRGVAAVARRGTELAARSSSVGERPLAVAQARQADGEDSKGLRRVLGESPVIMTLEEPEAPAVADEVAPQPRRTARPSVEPRVSRDAHAGRVARAATEARNQASVGRAGPPAATASAQPASQVAEATQRIVRAHTRPTQRIARAALAASHAPLNDTRRGLKAVEAPRVSVRSTPAALVSSVGAPSTVDAADARASTLPIGASDRTVRRSADSTPAMVGLDHQVAADDSDEFESVSAPAARPARVDGIARIAARTDAGAMDAAGRVTGATRYLTPEPAQASPERRVVVEHADGRFRTFDVASTETTRPMAIASTAPSMAMPEPEAAAPEEVDEAVAPRPRAARPAPVAVPRAKPAARASAPAPVSVAPSRVEARGPAGTQMRSVARAMQRSVPAESPRSIAMSRPAVQPARIERALTDVTAASAAAPVRTTSIAGVANAPTAPVSTPATRGSLQAAVVSRDAPRTAASEATGIRRRSRALPTVRAAARTLSQERWGARGRMLSPSVSRFVDAQSLDEVAEATAPGRAARRASASRSLEIPTAVAEPVLAALPVDAEADEQVETAPRGRTASRAVEVERRVARPVAEAAAPAVGPAARAAERATEHARVASGRTLAAPRVIAPFVDEAPETGTVPAARTARTLADRVAPIAGDRVAPAGATSKETPARERRMVAAPELVTAAPEGISSEVADEVAAGSVARATRRGAEIVPAARRTVLPQPTPELQQSEARRVVARTERRLSDAGEPSPFRTPTGRANAVTAPLDPVLVRSVADENPSEGVADAVMRANARAERPMAARADRGALGSVPGIDAYAPTLPARTLPVQAPDTAEGSTAQAVAGRLAPSTSVESPVARVIRRSDSTRTALASSPVTSARSFTDEVAAVQPRRTQRLAPDTVFAEPSFGEAGVAGEVPTQAPRPTTGAAPSARAHTGTRRPGATARRAPATVRALGRSRSRRDLRSVVPHPVGTARTARASARMLDRAPGAVAAPEAVLVRPEEVVDLASMSTSAGERNLPLTNTLAARAQTASGAVESTPIERLAERGAVAPVAQERRAPAALVDGMTLADAWSEPSYAEAADESVAGGRRAVGRLPGQDRSRFAPRKAESAVVRSALQDVLQNATVLRAAERGDDPVVSVPGVRRAAGLPADRSTRFEARVRASGRGIETVVVDTLTGEQIRTAGPTVLPQLGAEPAAETRRTTPIERAERRDAAVETVQGRSRTAVREAIAPQALLAQPQGEQVTGRAPLSQTFSELLDGQVPGEEAARPLLRRRTWNRRQLAHELGAFAPAMAEAEYLEAPTASDDAPAWARRAVTGTGVQQPQTRQTRGPGARADRGAPEGVTIENGEERAFEPSSLLGALSRADGPEELIKVIVERRTEVRTMRETLPAEAVRIVERLATLSPEETSVLTGSRTLQAQPRTNLAGPRRGRGGQGFTQLSGANDGHGANQVMKLADKLRNLIHLAENQRLADAHRELQMSQAAAKASSAAFEDPRGPGQSPDAQTMNMQKLQDDVWKSLQKQFEKLKTQMGDL